jgi:hypothetical protein
LNNKIELNWTASDEPDIALYEIWSSPTPKSGFTLLARQESGRYMIEGQTNFEPVYIAIRAVDKAGNEGGFTQPVKAVALPHPDLYAFAQPGPVLGGAVEESILLRAAKGPFIVETNLIVGPRGAIYAEPGTTILFRPDAGLTVNKGGLFLYGQSDKPIVLKPETATAPSGSYQGITMIDVPGGILTHVRIARASTGLKLVKSSPSVSHTEITGSSQAGIDLGDGAGPEITACYVHSNEGMGGILIAGEGLSPKIHGNIFENNTPFQVQSFVPVQIDLRNNYWGSPEPTPDMFLGEGLLLNPVLPARP